MRNGIRNFTPPARRPMIPEVTQLQMNVGHNGVQVVIVFSQAIKNIQMSEEQTEAHIKVLQESLDRLREMKK
jgi:hypothetical protein